MTTVQPQGEDLRKAVKWIADSLKYEKDVTVAGLIQAAATKFNLSPKDEQYLQGFYDQDGSDG